MQFILISVYQYMYHCTYKKKIADVLLFTFKPTGVEPVTIPSRD